MLRSDVLTTEPGSRPTGSRTGTPPSSGSSTACASASTTDRRGCCSSESRSSGKSLRPPTGTGCGASARS